MSKIFKHISLVVFLLLFSNLAFTQNKGVVFDRITMDDGLSQSSVNCIIQDSKGYIWLGTQNGLNKYNGSSSLPFKIYQKDILDTNSLSDNWIYSIAEDASGNIWTGTVSGLNKLDPETDIITRYFHDPKNYKSINDNRVYGVCIGKDGSVWVKTKNALNRLNPNTNEFRHYEHYLDVFSTDATNFSFPIIEDQNGDIWIGTADGVNKFNVKLEQFERYTTTNTDISDNYINAIHEDRDGFLWIGTKYGLNRFNVKSKKVKKYFYQDNNKNSISDNDVKTICEDFLGNIWVGTFASGLNKLNPYTGDITRYRYSIEDVNSLGSDAVISVYEDNSKILWIGTYGAGLSKLDIKKKKFELYNAKSHGISQNEIAGIYSDKDFLWVGLWGKGLDVYNKITGKIDHFSTESDDKHKIINDFVHVIFKDSQERIWLGTRDGINVIDRKNNIDSLIKYFPEVNIRTRVTSIIEDTDNNIWITTERGVHVLNIKTGEASYYYHIIKDNTSLSDNHTYAVIQDSDGDIWIGTNEGLNLFQSETNTFKSFKHAPSNSNTLINNSINSLTQDKKGNIWLATKGGVNKFIKETNKFIAYTKKDGFPSDLIYGVVEDNNGNLWFSTGWGVAMLNPETNFIRSFDKDDGLGSYELNLGSVHKSNDGEIFFGGNAGFNSFYPDAMKDNDNIPPLVFLSFKASSSEKDSVFNVQNNSVINLTFKENTIRIDFAALEFTQPENNSYKYKLEPMDKDWISIGNQNFKTFNNVPAGEYSFRVKGSNNDLIWNEKEIKLDIIVSPHPLKSNWAYAIYAFIFVFVIYIIIEFRTKSLKQANYILQEKQLAALEIAKQKEELTVKNKSITDSINYAKRIQQAMMPSKYLFKKLLPDFFILYKPKDIVSGDFYWVTGNNNKIFIAAVDCTGHGVPGAFMSIIGFDLLRNITGEQGVENPAQILNKLNDGVSETFSKNIEDHTVKDGMDIALCVIDKNTRTIEYAGAYNPLYLIRDNNIIEVKANRFSVGMVDGESEDKKFDSHSIEYRDDDVMYLFTDGYPDQFGGPLGKKFKYRRFRHLLLTMHNLPMVKQRDFLNENIDNWRGDLEQVDDILVIGVRMSDM